jgi:hypothetical protein
MLGTQELPERTLREPAGEVEDRGLESGRRGTREPSPRRHVDEGVDRGLERLGAREGGEVQPADAAEAATQGSHRSVESRAAAQRERDSLPEPLDPLVGAQAQEHDFPPVEGSPRGHVLLAEGERVGHDLRLGDAHRSP